jgi:hypothetical protein
MMMLSVMHEMLYTLSYATDMVDAGQLILRENERGKMRILVSFLRERPRRIWVPLGKWK